MNSNNMLFCCNKVVLLRIGLRKHGKHAKKNFDFQFDVSHVYAGYLLRQKARLFGIVSLKVRQRELERGFGVKITSDSVFTGEGMRSEVLRIGVHSSSSSSEQSEFHSDYAHRSTSDCLIFV